MSAKAKVSPRVYGRRLLKLARFLEQLPRRRFDYSVWVGEDWKGAKDLSCGTTACALGWATAIPAFQKLGLELHRVDSYFSYVRLKGDRRRRIMEAVERASREVFGLTPEEHRHIFEGQTLYELSTDGYFMPATQGLSLEATPKQVAKQIRRFVKRRFGMKEAAL